MAQLIGNPFSIFLGLDGNPLENGKIYIGVENMEPTTSPQTVYWDAAGTTPATQPIRTIAGMPLRSGSPAQLYASSNFSIRVRTALDVDVFYQASVTNTGVDALRSDLLSSSGTLGSSLVTFLAVSGIGRTVQAKLRDVVSVMDYGAVGDGVTNDTTAINNAAAYAATIGGSLIFPDGKTFLINNYISILNGTKAVIGEGGVIKLAAGAVGGVLLKGKESGAAANVSGCHVHGLVINLNAQAGFGIYGQNPTACHISHNRIFGCDTAQAGILIRSFDNGLEAARDNIIDSNLIDGTGNTGSAGIQVDSPTGLYKPVHNRISNNRIFGFQYGISLSYAQKGAIFGATITGPSRCVSIQNSCDDNLVIGVAGIDFTGNCVHVVDSDRVRVKNCTATTTSVITGEGTFQAYKGSEDCTFDNCETYIPSSSSTGPEFHFYAGASVSRTTFTNCRAKGIASRSYFCLESGYKVTAYSAYGRNKSGVVEADAIDDTVDAGFINCVANGTSSIPAFALLQVTLTGPTVRALTRPIVKNCRALGDSYSHQLYVFEETASNWSAGILTGNEFNATSAVGKFNLPRGRAHFSTWYGNAVLDTELQGSATSDVANIPAQSIGTVAITVTGAVVGDLVTSCGSSTALEAGLQMSAEITAADTVTVKLQNASSGGIDPASRTYYATVRKRLF